MMSYFKPLRRKVGAATLVMACVFAAGWVRSIFAVDIVVMSSVKTTLVLASGDRDFFWKTQQIRQNALRWPTWQALPNTPGLIDPNRNGYVVIPYWSIVIPLALLSAYLLLSRPRVKADSPLQPEP